MNKTKLKLFLSVLAFATLGSFMFAKPASALNPNDIPNNMRNDISNYDGGCPAIAEKYMLNTWVSPSGQPTQTSLTVPYGTQDVNLDLNQLVFVCRQYVSTNGASYPGLPQDGTVTPTAYNGSISRATSGFSATNGSLQNTGGLQTQSSIFRNNSTRYWFPNPIQFTYHANSPLTVSQVVHVSFNQKFANIFGGSIACSVPPGPGGTVGNLENCNEGPVDFDITINVTGGGWSLSSNTTANKPTILAGDNVTFNYDLHNNGPAPADFQYVTRVQEYVNGVAQPVNSWPVPNAVEGGLPAGASEPNYSVRTYTSSLTPGLSRVCSWIEYAGQSSSNGAPGASNQACVTIQQPVTTCMSSTFAPTVVGSPTNFVVRVGYSPFIGSPLPAPNFSYTIAGPNGNTSGTSPASWSAGVMQSGTISYTPPTAGSYTLSWSYNGTSCGTPAIVVGYSPYFSTSAGDVSAGNGFNWGGVCAGNDNASIKSWNLNDIDPANYGGGTAGLAALVTANNGLQHFVSAGETTGGAANQAGHGLSLANYSGSSYVSNPTFGTSIGASSVLPCVHDYQADAPTKTPLGTTVTSAAASALAADNYSVSADLTLGSGADIVLDGGRKITIYVDGDVYIQGNILYSYGQISDIPMLRIVAKGGIYIDSSVTELHGMFIAQSKGASGAPHTQGGIFATCATGLGTVTTDYGTCNHKLTIIGAVAAENQVLLGRTFGSLVADPSKNVPAEPAELFRYSPELWLNPANGPANAPLTYQSFTSLPPVL